MKKSVIAAVAASNLTIFSGLVNASEPEVQYQGYTWEQLQQLGGWMVEQLCWSKKEFWIRKNNGARLHKCYYIDVTGRCVAESEVCGIDLEGNDVVVSCNDHRDPDQLADDVAGIPWGFAICL